MASVTGHSNELSLLDKDNGSVSPDRTVVHLKSTLRARERLQIKLVGVSVWFIAS